MLVFGHEEDGSAVYDATLRMDFTGDDGDWTRVVDGLVVEASDGEDGSLTGEDSELGVKEGALCTL